MQQQQAAARAAERAAAASEDARWARRAPLTAPALPSRHAAKGPAAGALSQAWDVVGAAANQLGSWPNGRRRQSCRHAACGGAGHATAVDAP